MRFDHLGASSFRDDRLPAYGAQLVNCFAHRRQGEEGAPGAYFVAGTVALDLVHTAGGPIGALFEFGGSLYAVAGADVVRVSGTPATIASGVMPGSGVCDVAIDRTGAVLLRDGATVFFDGASVSAFTPVDGDTMSSVAWLDNFTLYGKANSSKFYQSDAVAPKTVDASYYATKESRPDNLVRMIANKRNLMLFGERSIEPYYNQGISGGVTFGAYQNAMIELGLLAKWSLVAMHGVGYFLADNRKVYTFTDVTVEDITPVWLAMLLRSRTAAELQSMVGLTYVYEGVQCYALTLPGVFTVEYSAGLWHHRTSPGATYWRPRVAALYQGDYWFGSADDGRVWRGSGPGAFEGSDPIERAVTTSAFGPKEDRTVLQYVDAHLNPYGADGGTFRLDYSDDEGRTWSSPRTVAFPQVGRTRAIERNLGQFRRRMLRIRYAGAAPFRLEDLYIGMQAGWPRGRYTPEQAGAMAVPTQ